MKVDRNEFGGIEDENGFVVAMGVAEQHQESIVRAVNTHDALVEALENLLGCLSSMNDDPAVLNAYKCHYDLDDLLSAQKALAAAKGEDQ